MNGENKTEEKKDDTLGVGESIKLGGNAKPDETAKADNPPPQESTATPAVSVRKRVGSARVKTARDRIAAGTASDSDVELVRADDDARKKRVDTETPPGVTSSKKSTFGVGTGGAWREKYGGAVGGREMVCTEVAQYVHAGSYKLARYIKDNGGSPIIDPDNDEHGKRWYNILVLAADEVIPPHVTAAPHLLAALGIGTLTLQGAHTAYKKRKAKKAEVASGEEAVKKALPATEAIKQDAAPVGEVQPEETKKQVVKPVRERERV